MEAQGRGRSAELPVSWPRPLLAMVLSIALVVVLIGAYLGAGLLLTRSANADADGAVRAFNGHGHEYDTFFTSQNAVISSLSANDPQSWQSALRAEQSELDKVTATDAADRSRLRAADGRLEAAENPLTLPERPALERSRSHVETALSVLADVDTVVPIYKRQFSVLSTLFDGIGAYYQATDRIKAQDFAGSLPLLDQAGSKVDDALNQAHLQSHLGAPVLNEMTLVRQLVSDTRALVVATQTLDRGAFDAAQAALNSDIAKIDAAVKVDQADPLYGQDDYVKYLLSDLQKRLSHQA